MSAPNWIDGGFLAPPSASKTTVHSHQNGTQSAIMIEPTPEYQRFWNQNRHEMDRHRLELHVTEGNNLEPPHAQPMSRSTTSDSLPSPSTVCSYAGESNMPLSPDRATEPVKSKTHRGRRKGPLDMETRTKTAFKRKFKLTCDFHRTKKTSCNCHDFSKLEEGYQLSLIAEGQKAKASRNRPVRAYGDIGTFGAGGAALTTSLPRYQNFDLPELPTGHELPHVSASVRSVLDLDIKSEASVNAIVSAPREEPFFLVSAAPLPTPTEFAIGSSMPFHNRWECQYRYGPAETRSVASADSCTWTGPYQQLDIHFKTDHHSFEPAKAPFRSRCSNCGAESLKWYGKRACTAPEECPSECWQRWLFGASGPQLNPNPVGLTVSEASGSRSSWLAPSWHMTTPGSTNTEQSNHPHGAFNTTSGFYERSVSEKEINEAVDSDGRHDTYRLQNRYRYQADAANPDQQRCVANQLPLFRWMSRPSSTLYDPQTSLPPRLRPCRHLILPLLAPLVVLHLQGALFPINLGCALLAFIASAWSLKWYLALSTVGFLIAWIAIRDGLRARPKKGHGLHALVPVI
ncbi:hypothetical protein F4802DRAFT_286757 [Xylaria palmicola]|nr:hypothetical protein F4802DRAFT_286757 [Xylaria palmicola]